jgi:sterol desaturase/sphingolipid hydroxylase (fatty acid hydroxylase superfamily)
MHFTVFPLPRVVFRSVDLWRQPAWLFARKHQPRVPFVVNGSAFRPSVRNLVINVATNQLFVILPGLILLDAACRDGYLPGGIRMTRTLPPWSDIVQTALLSVALVELCFYTSHRLLHVPWLYHRFHKQHHNFKAPIALAAVYAHPVEVLVGNTFAVMGPAFFVGMHGAVWYIGIVLGFLSTQSSHAGFDLNGRFHDRHHECFNCNYGNGVLGGLLDRLLNTHFDHGAAVQAK